MAMTRIPTRRLLRLSTSPFTVLAAMAVGLMVYLNIKLQPWVMMRGGGLPGGGGRGGATLSTTGPAAAGPPPELAPARPTASVETEGIDWSRLYIVQYAASPAQLCNAVMMWHQIERIGSRSQRLLLFPAAWDPEALVVSDAFGEEYSDLARLLHLARDDYYVKLRPLEALRPVADDAVVGEGDAETPTPTTPADGPWWPDAHQKLLAFNLTEFDRVLALDSDASVRGNLDELFLLPDAPLAMPLVHGGAPADWHFSAQMMVIRPSASDFARVQAELATTTTTTTTTTSSPVDLAHTLFGPAILAIPQRPFSLLTSEFRRPNHAAYLHSKLAEPDPTPPQDPLAGLDPSATDEERTLLLAQALEAAALAITAAAEAESQLTPDELANAALAAAETQQRLAQTYIWDAERALAEARFVGFREEPEGGMPGPWVRAPKELLNAYMPGCARSEWFGATDCSDREAWLALYGDFARRRREVCGRGFELLELV